MHHASSLSIRITPSLEPGSGCAEAGDGMAAPGVAENSVGQVSDRKPGSRRPMPR